MAEAVQDTERDAFENDRLQEAAGSLEHQAAELDDDSPWKEWLLTLAVGLRVGRLDESKMGHQLAAKVTES